MSLRQPQGQTRTEYGDYFGIFNSLASCPNGSAYPATAAAQLAAAMLEAGDTAYVDGLGRVHCKSAGTPGALDAVWGIPTINLVFAENVTGTSPLVIGAVYLAAGLTIAASSHAILGTAAGGTGTVQLRRQGTGVLLAGASWAVTGALADDALAGAVAVTVSDWYMIELVGDAGGTVALAYGLQLNF